MYSQADWEWEAVAPLIEVSAPWDTFTSDTGPALAAALELLGHE
ncbi:MAG: hypothetical protein AB1449_06510 [Chloroflexota bacterium]